jgi:LysM repeat protein
MRDRGPEAPGEGVRLRYTDARTASPRASICPFLRSAVDDDLTFPVEASDPSNVCAALDKPLAQSTRQQELVCLVAAHATCPRYLRGVLIAPTAERRPERAFLSPAIAASLAVLLVSAIVSVGYVAAAGGLSVPLTAASSSASPPPDASAVAVVTIAPTAARATPAPTPSASDVPSSSPSALATPTASPAPTPTPEPTVKPTPKPTASARPTPEPKSDRFTVLTPCADRSDCYVYVVRVGDNLYSIAHWFGVSLASIDALNPWVATTALRAGQELRIPTPTR